jgi:tetratricopeptide (TPR) repeat protein
MAKGKKPANKSKTVKFDDLFNLAKSSFDSSKFEKADGYFDKSRDQAMANNDEPALALSYFGGVMSLIHQEKYDDAMQMINESRKIMGDYLDSYFLEILLNQHQGNHRETLAAAQKYLEIRRKQDQKPHLSSSAESYIDILWMASDSAWKQAEFNMSLDFQHQALEADPSQQYRRIVYASNLGKQGKVDDAMAVLNEGMRINPMEIAFENAKALIYGDQEKYDDARRILENILKRNPRDVDAIVNLGVICEKHGNYEGAIAQFKLALTIEPQHEVALSNLSHISESIDTSYQKISLCMILKNEEKFLPGCLRTAKDLVDEIIVVDTGSTDRTMEIAREYGAKVYEHSWQNDFSLHRNQSMDYATGDWILILDADEELEPSEHALIRSATARREIDAVTFVVYNKIQGGRTGFLNSHRLFRSGKGYHYSGIVHNQLMMDGISLASQFKVIHHGYGLSDEQMRAKGKRTEALLMKQIEENPDNAFAHFNLAQIYRGLGEPQKSLDHALKVIENLSVKEIDRRHVYVMALDQIGCAYVGLEQLEKAKEYFYKALEIKDDYLDPLFNLGYVYSKEGKFDKADEIFHRYLRVREAFSEHKEWIGLILNNLNSQFAVYFGLGISQFFHENYDKALEYFHKVIDQVGDFEHTQHLIARCYRAKGQVEKVLFHCDKAIDYGHEDAEIYLLKGEAYLNLKDSQNAVLCFRKSLELDKTYSASQLGLASAATLDGDIPKAMELISEVIAETPQSPQALAARGDLLYHDGNFKSAENDYKSQTLLNPDDPACLNNLANSLLKQNNLASAEEYYRRALDVSPDFAISYRNLAISLMKQIKTDEAISYFEKYLNLAQNDHEARLVLADLYYNRKSYWQALACYEFYLNNCPLDINVLLRLSDCYFNLGKFGSAAMGYKAVLKANPQHALATNRLSDLSNFAKPVASE